MSDLPKLKLYYFNIKGRGEAIRLLCAYCGINLEEHLFKDYNEFLEFRNSGKLVFGQVPMLEVNDNDQLVQSASILRYLGKLLGLYPLDDHIVAAHIDAALSQEEDAFLGPLVCKYTKRFGIDIDDETKAKCCDLIKAEVAPRHLTAMEKLLETSQTGWIANTEKPSPADFVWYIRFASYIPENIPEFYTDNLDKYEDYPKIKAFIDKFEALDAIKKYYAEKK